MEGGRNTIKSNVVFIGHLINGKTTSAQYLIHKYGYEHLSFAVELKKATADMLTTFSNTIHELPRVVTIEELEQRKRETEVRKILQTVGTEVGKVFFCDPDVWVRRLEKKIKAQTKPFTVDDCRFPNEQEMLMQHNCIFVRVIRPDYEKVLIRQYQENNPTLPREAVAEQVRNAILHPSEQYVGQLFHDFEIVANDPVELYRQIEEKIGVLIGD